MDYKDFGRQVRDIRRHQGLTQDKLAEKAGISASFLGHIERGSRKASLETLIQLCNTLKVTPQSLLIASLSDDLVTEIAPTLSEDDRARLHNFLRIAQDTRSTWEE